MALRSSLAHIRAARISLAVVTAPPAGFVPPPQGMGLPFPLPPGVSADRGSSGAGAEGSHSQAKEKTRGLLEERVERDAWRGALDALTRLIEPRRAVDVAEAEAQPREGWGLQWEGILKFSSIFVLDRVCIQSSSLIAS